MWVLALLLCSVIFFLCVELYNANRQLGAEIKRFDELMAIYNKVEKDFVTAYQQLQVEKQRADNYMHVLDRAVAATLKADIEEVTNAINATEKK